MTETAGPVDTRPILHYRGDINKHGEAVSTVVGPNAWGEFLVIDECQYDKETDMTTAKLRYATTKDLGITEE